MKGVYLLHFEPRYKHAGHYLGYADDVSQRVYEHEMGQSGARLTMAASASGSTLHLVRVWPGEDRTFERSLKGRGVTGKAHRGSLKRYCPVCQGKFDLKTARRMVTSDLELKTDFPGIINLVLGVSVVRKENNNEENNRHHVHDGAVCIYLPG